MYAPQSAPRHANLLVDIEVGTVLEAPPSPVVSRRWAESHPFVELQGEYLIAGPDAARVAGGSGGTDYNLYRIASDVAGVLRLERER